MLVERLNGVIDTILMLILPSLKLKYKLIIFETMPAMSSPIRGQG